MLDADIVHRGHRDNRERFINFIQINVVRAPSQLGMQIFDGRYRCGRKPGGFLGKARMADQRRNWFQAVLSGNGTACATENADSRARVTEIIGL